MLLRILVDFKVFLGKEKYTYISNEENKKHLQFLYNDKYSIENLISCDLGTEVLFNPTLKYIVLLVAWFDIGKKNCAHKVYLKENGLLQELLTQVKLEMYVLCLLINC